MTQQLDQRNSEFENVKGIHCINIIILVTHWLRGSSDMTSKPLSYSSGLPQISRDTDNNASMYIQ